MAQPPCPALHVGSRRPYKANKGRASALGLAIRVAETGNQAAPLQTCQRQKPPAPPCAPGPSRHTHRPTLLSGASPARLWPASCPPRDARARAAPPPPAPALLSLPALTPPPPPLSISATRSERRRKKGAVGGVCSRCAVGLRCSRLGVSNYADVAPPALGTPPGFVCEFQGAGMRGEKTGQEKTGGGGLLVERPSSGAEPGRSGRDALGRGGGAAGGTGVMRGKGKRSRIEGSDQRRKGATADRR